MNQDILQILPYEKLPELRNILKKNYPKNIHAYNLINTTIEMQKSKPNIVNYIKIYVPEGYKIDATFITIIEMSCYDVFIYTEDKTLNKLEKTLKETKIIKWKNNPLFFSLDFTYLEMIKKVQNEIGINYFPRIIPTIALYLKKENAFKIKYSMSDDLFIAPLKQNHAKIMNEVWPHKRPGSEKFIAEIIELYGGIGLFSKVDNELCAWVLKNYFGGLGSLQTKDKHQRKGYGSLLIKIFSKILAETNKVDVLAIVVEKNYASKTIFEKIGFLETKRLSLTFF